MSKEITVTLNECYTLEPDMKRHFLIHMIFITVLTIPVRCKVSINQDLIEFSSNNGIKFVTFLINTTNYDKKTLFKEAIKNGIKSRFLSKINIEGKKEEFDDTLVIFYDKDIDFNLSLERIQSRKIFRSILVLQETNLESLQTKLKNENTNSLFFLLSYNGTKSTWYQIFTLKNNHQAEIVMNELCFDSFGRILKSYDLKGTKILTKSLSWSPFVNVADCDKKGMECNSNGLLVDLMEFWAKDSNFTWDIHEDIHGDWGTKPKSGKNYPKFQDQCVAKSHFLMFNYAFSRSFQHEWRMERCYG